MVSGGISVILFSISVFSSSELLFIWVVSASSFSEESSDADGGSIGWTKIGKVTQNHKIVAYFMKFSILIVFLSKLKVTLIQTIKSNVSIVN